MKSAASVLLVAGGADALFRLVNRKKLLVVMYHAVTDRAHDPPVWTHLPLKRFREQLSFLKKHYQVIPLQQLLDVVHGIGALPPRAALITFDDGYRNNYRVAFPLLREMGLPAAIFLTVDRIGSAEPLWLDELYLLLSAAGRKKGTVPFVGKEAADLFAAGKIWEAYWSTAEVLKRCGEEERNGYLELLRAKTDGCDPDAVEDFRLLDWGEVLAMRDSGLVEFGVHTASHQILSELPQSQWQREIEAPRRKLEQMLGTPQEAFCFPNGRPGIDFSAEHLQYLKSCHYRCSFTTAPGLFCPKGGDFMQICRIAAGNDVSSDPFFFRLNTSGFLPAARVAVGSLTGR